MESLHTTYILVVRRPEAPKPWCKLAFTGRLFSEHAYNGIRQRLAAKTGSSAFWLVVSADEHDVRHVTNVYEYHEILRGVLDGGSASDEQQPPKDKKGRVVLDVWPGFLDYSSVLVAMGAAPPGADKVPVREPNVVVSVGPRAESPNPPVSDTEKLTSSPASAEPNGAQWKERKPTSPRRSYSHKVQIGSCSKLFNIVCNTCDKRVFIGELFYQSLDMPNVHVCAPCFSTGAGVDREQTYIASCDANRAYQLVSSLNQVHTEQSPVDSMRGTPADPPSVTAPPPPKVDSLADEARAAIVSIEEASRRAIQDVAAAKAAVPAPAPAPAQAAPAEPVMDTLPAKHHAFCDSCESPIVGTRHKCFDCPDYDLCDSCFPRAGFFHANHMFAALESPENLHIPKGYSIQNRRAAIAPQGPAAHVRHSNVICDECDRSIIGPRFKCADPACADFDLCQPCFAKSAHNLDHTFVCVRQPAFLKQVVVSKTAGTLSESDEATECEAPCAAPQAPRCDVPVTPDLGTVTDPSDLVPSYALALRDAISASSFPDTTKFSFETFESLVDACSSEVSRLRDSITSIIQEARAAREATLSRSVDHVSDADSAAAHVVPQRRDSVRHIRQLDKDCVDPNADVDAPSQEAQPDVAPETQPDVAAPNDEPESDTKTPFTPSLAVALRLKSTAVTLHHPTDGMHTPSSIDDTTLISNFNTADMITPVLAASGHSESPDITTDESPAPSVRTNDIDSDFDDMGDDFDNVDNLDLQFDSESLGSLDEGVEFVML